MAVISNPKWERFAQELAAGQSQQAAYGIAGFKGKHLGNPSALAKKAALIARVAELLAERAEMHGQATAAAIEQEGLTKAWIIARLRENAERALQAIPVIKDGKPTGEYVYEGSVANRALELLGKELGMFIDRKHVSGGLVISHEEALAQLQ